MTDRTCTVKLGNRFPRVNLALSTLPALGLDTGELREVAGILRNPGNF